MRPSPNAPQVVKPDGGGAFNRDEEKRLNAMKALFMAVSNSAGAAQRARAKEEQDKLRQELLQVGMCNRPTDWSTSVKPQSTRP